LAIIKKHKNIKTQTNFSMEVLAATKIQTTWRKFNVYKKYELKDKIEQLLKHFDNCKVCEKMFEKIHNSHFNTLIIKYIDILFKLNTISIIFVNEDKYEIILNDKSFQLNNIEIKEYIDKLKYNKHILNVNIEGFFLDEESIYRYPYFYSIKIV
jgi:hypothetical protein